MNLADKLSIRPCVSTLDLQNFAQTPLELEMIQFPFTFKREHWLVEKNNKIIGRIAACISLSDPNRGYIGFYENDLEDSDRESISVLLLSTAESWLKKHGIRTVFGPINYSTWFNYRFQTEVERTADATDSQFEWEPTLAPEYFSDWKNNGFSIADTYHSKAYSKIGNSLKPTEPAYQKFIEQGFSMRPMQFQEFPEREAKAITKINRNSFSDNFIVEPIDPVAYQKLYAAPFSKYISDLCFFMLDPDKNEIGYNFSFVDQGYFVWKTMAIMKEFQGKSISTASIHYSLCLAQKKGVDNMVAALIRAGAPSEVLLNKISTALWTHHYSLLKKEI